MIFDRSQTAVKDYKVSLFLLKDIKELGKKWRSLEKKAHPDYFLSWSWIHTWLKIFTPHAYVLQATYKDKKTVALSLISFSQEKRHNFINSNQIRFHQTGDKNQDQIWVEYNGFLEDKEHFPHASIECINKLIHKTKDWDEIVISMIREKYNQYWKNYSFNAHIISKKPTYSVNLTQIRESSQSYLSTLSSNTRYQIKRSIRLYEKKGKLKIEKARSVEDAIEFFLEAAPWHKKRWKDSGYHNNEFINFHKELINNGFSHKEIAIFKVTIDKYLIGIIYCFIYNEQVYFYLHALNYDKESPQNKKLKPGLVSHSLLIQYFLGRKIKHYHFMGGEGQYKKSLGEAQDNLVSIVIQKPLLRFKIENILRTIKNWHL